MRIGLRKAGQNQNLNSHHTVTIKVVHRQRVNERETINNYKNLNIAKEI